MPVQNSVMYDKFVFFFKIFFSLIHYSKIKCKEKCLMLWYENKILKPLLLISHKCSVYPDNNPNERKEKKTCKKNDSINIKYWMHIYLFSIDKTEIKHLNIINNIIIEPFDLITFHVFLFCLITCLFKNY